MPRASFGTVNVTAPPESLPVIVLVVEPFLSLTVTLPVALDCPLGVVIFTLYLPAVLLVGALTRPPSILLDLIFETFLFSAVVPIGGKTIGVVPGGDDEALLLLISAAGVTVSEPVRVNEPIWSSPAYDSV